MLDRSKLGRGGNKVVLQHVLVLGSALIKLAADSLQQTLQPHPHGVGRFAGRLTDFSPRLAGEPLIDESGFVRVEPHADGGEQLPASGRLARRGSVIGKFQLVDVPVDKPPNVPPCGMLLFDVIAKDVSGHGQQQSQELLGRFQMQAALRQAREKIAEDGLADIERVDLAPQPPTGESKTHEPVYVRLIMPNQLGRCLLVSVTRFGQ